MDRADLPEPTPNGRGTRFSVAQLTSYWYVACRTPELGSRPLARTILGTPLVLFRDRTGRAGALLDRCPHRNVPLSRGRVKSDGSLECSYHGWRFDVEGVCVLVPGLRSTKGEQGRRVNAYPVIERDGFVWVYGSSENSPQTEPYSIPALHEPGYTTVIRTVDVEGSLHQAAENALDVPHTAYLHRGFFRGGPKNPITAIVRNWGDRLEVEYQGEPRPPGIVARVLSPQGGIVEHWDRFFLPSIAQVEYRLGPETHFLVTSVMTPVTDFHTRMFAIISFRLRFWGWLVKPALTPLALRVFHQDRDILRAQSECVRAFGGERFLSTEIDLLGPSIWKLLKGAQRGDAAPRAEPLERSVEFLA